MAGTHAPTATLVGGRAVDDVMGVMQDVTVVGVALGDTFRGPPHDRRVLELASLTVTDGSRLVAGAGGRAGGRDVPVTSLVAVAGGVAPTVVG